MLEHIQVRERFVAPGCEKGLADEGRTCRAGQVRAMALRTQIVEELMAAGRLGLREPAVSGRGGFH